jgi:hypothetical protein
MCGVWLHKFGLHVGTKTYDRVSRIKRQALWKTSGIMASTIAQRNAIQNYAI